MTKPPTDLNNKLEREIDKLFVDNGYEMQFQTKLTRDIASLFKSHMKELLPEKKNSAIGEYDLGWTRGHDAGFNDCRDVILERLEELK